MGECQLFPVYALRCTISVICAPKQQSERYPVIKGICPLPARSPVYGHRVSGTETYSYQTSLS
ncbi:hypothetical protein [Methanoregula formicica]|uniref:Uncharacterized protein n=1 Tax=Methanoregula formicica (strain DSM 22288 / NBRC 105244 / SMSP) TaxID=593750 RepID=L0HGQ2_METFS|nr:hypothetical protein [Methanoregula formicica]AGB02971.1 hypothetical protein Metfor_1956 [Methanoregula formicica SMSP]